MTARSPLRGRYLVQNRALRAALTVTDTVLGVLPSRDEAGRRPAPRRVLLSMGGHLGDVVIASSAVALVRAAWPDAEVGIVVGSWARGVIDGHPLVDRVHTVDHWKLNRGTGRLAAKVRRFESTKRKALREIREVGYDLAIELYPFFPNNIPLLWRAGIPARIGYRSGGFGPLLTEAVDWREADRHMTEFHRELVIRAGGEAVASTQMRYSLPRREQPSTRELSYTGRTARGGDYLVLHMGAGLALKEWPPEKWHALIGRLLDAGHSLLLTGSGPGQAEQIDRAIDGRPGCRNLCDHLSWSEFVEVVGGAKLLVCVDSVAGHVGAAAGTPTVVLMSGMNRIEQWRPLGERVLPVTRPVPCAPCHQSRGCAAMSCVRLISVDEVLAAVQQQLSASAATGALVAER